MQPLIITRLLFVESGTYNNMAYRPYTATADPSDVKALQEAIHNRPTITVPGLAGVAGRVIYPSTEAMGVVPIANGWNARRFLFLMEVDIPSALGAGFKQLVCGYTDRLERSHNGTLDPTMELFINSVTTLRATTEDRGWGPQTYYVPVDNSQILVGEYNIGFNTLNALPTSLRPMDVFDTVGMSMAPSDVVRIDQRTTFSDGPCKSRRSNNIAGDYLSRVLNNASAAFANDDSGDLPLTMSYAADSVKEDPISEDFFIKQFLSRGAFTPNSSIQYQSLLYFDPTLDQTGHSRVDVIMRGNGQQLGAVAHEAGSTEHWNGNLPETIMANILAQSVPALMTENLITKANISFTNRTPDNQFAITVDNAPGDEGINGFIRGLDLTSYVQRFFFKLNTMVLRDLSRNNLIDIAVTMRVRVTSETWIRISVSGKPPVDFVFPSFSDALLSPCLAGTQQPLQVMSGRVGALINTINTIPMGAVNMTSPSPTAMPMGGDIFQSYGGNYGTSGKL